MPITYTPKLGLSQIPVGTDGATANNERNTDMVRIEGMFAVSSFTSGAVLFGSGTGLITEDAAGFVWNNTTNHLGLGTSGPQSRLHISGSSLTESHIRLSDTTTGIDTTLRGTGNTFDIDLNPYVAPENLAVRFFYGSSTISGTSKLEIYDGLIAGVPVLNAVIGGNGVDTRFAMNNGSVGIGVSPVDICAILEISSVTKGVLFPRMSAGQVTAIPSPGDGLVVFDATIQQLRIFRSGAWHRLLAVL